MPFASTSLAARIERAECRLLVDSAEAAARRRPGTGVFATPLAGGVAAYTEPGAPLNKIAGLGFGGPLDEEALGAVERAFAERGSAVQAEVASLADPSIGRTLTARGYVLQNVENLLGRGLPAGPAAPRAAGIEVAPSPLDELALWMDVVVTGFATPDAQGVPSHESFPHDLLERVMADMAVADGFSRYLARRDGVPAGGASLRLFDGVAHLCGAATLAEHRRCGVQGALLAARLEIASAAGCDVAVIVTQPGSKSQENAQRHGFDLLYTRAILVRTP
jgi:ribosomal protein S18 acetylase RimI-like enzyme